MAFTFPLFDPSTITEMDSMGEKPPGFDHGDSFLLRNKKGILSGCSAKTQDKKYPYNNVKMIRTYSLKHSLDVGKFLYAYIAVLNSMIHDIWTTIEWEEKPIEGKKQKRPIPYYKKDKVTKSILRNGYLENWEYANH